MAAVKRRSERLPARIAAYAILTVTVAGVMYPMLYKGFYRVLTKE